MGGGTLLQIFDIDNLELLKEWSKDIKIPLNPLIQGSIYDNQVLMGAGFIKLVGEATIVLNPAITKLDKMETIRTLFAEAKLRCARHDIDKLVVFTDNQLYARLLKKRFNFSDSSGIGLQLEI